MNIAVLVSGGGTNLQAIIDRIESHTLPNVHITLVLSSSPDAYALVRAQQHRITTTVVSRKQFADLMKYDEKMLEELEKASPDLIVLAGFLSLLGPKVVSFYKNRIINIHPSLIPSFCGPGMYGIRPHIAALEKGVRISGATVHFVSEIYDDGPIFLQKSVEVLAEDTPESLQKRIMEECEQSILPQAIQLIADGRVCIENNKVKIMPEGTGTCGGNHD